MKIKIYKDLERVEQQFTCAHVEVKRRRNLFRLSSLSVRLSVYTDKNNDYETLT